MKPFRSVITEAARSKTRVVLFGRMNPVTSGHEENVKAAHDIAQKHNAELHVIASHTHDKKKNPLTRVQKLTHLKRAFGHLPHTHIDTSSPDEPSILHQAAKAHAAGVKHFVVAGGGDRAAGYHKLLHDYNGVAGKSHGYYKFDRITTENTGERKAGISGTDMRKHAAGGHYEKFKANLPSKIRSNEKHAQHLYHDVRHGMGMHEEDAREAYVAGTVLRLGETVFDNYTGLTGEIVYRGPTYVTVQINEDLAVKRWLNAVDSLQEEDGGDEAPTARTSFSTYMQSHAKADPQHISTERSLDRLKNHPEARNAFHTDAQSGTIDPFVLAGALDSTAHYLNILDWAEGAGKLDDHAVSEFERNLSRAAGLLGSVNALHHHHEYMKNAAHRMMKIAPHANLHSEAFDPNRHQESEDVTEKDLEEIERHIDQLSWEDIEHLYADQEHQEAEEEFELDGAVLDEALTAAQRMKKRLDFLKTKSRREIAARVARHRVSTPARMKKRAVVGARSMIMQRLLRGRDKSKLSAAEKDRIEAIVRRSRPAIARISNRLLPKLRKLEQERLRHHREGVEVSNTVVNNAAVQLAGGKLPMQHPSAPEQHKGVRRLKQYRKMEV
jgi:hypothetical protein